MHKSWRRKPNTTTQMREKIQDDLGETFLMAISLSRLYSLAIRSVQRHKKANVDIISRQVSTVEMVICRNIFKSIPLTLSLEPRPSTSTENCVLCISTVADEMSDPVYSTIMCQSTSMQTARLKLQETDQDSAYESLEGTQVQTLMDRSH
ncbi:hypothetical protein MG293_018707 [Ovis ammon polii]|uniref:Uncharacterized protein n=1 Tax=Ovis ammon polii TaxID=230172 RepID=A0AAD4TR44_OVIAM|nr:hypothetical protein MG293_018707 [Ovis ammon polii]